MQRSPAENLLTQRSPAGLNCHHSVPLRSSLGNAAPPCEEQLVTQSPSCEVVLLTQHLPARIVVDADLSCEAPSYTRGAHGSEGAYSYIAGLVAATAVVTEPPKPAGKRGTP
jgi:hypothetical protein